MPLMIIVEYCVHVRIYRKIYRKEIIGCIKKAKIKLGVMMG